MDLDRDLAQADVAGYLLVQPACDNARHDLSLARGQSLEALPERCNNLGVLPPGAVPRNAEVNGVEQLLVAKWLSEKLDGASLHGLHCHGNVAVAGDEDDWKMD